MLAGYWKDDEIDARNNVATMRRANTFKARWVSAGLLLQLAVLLALAAAVAIIITRA